MAENHQDSKIGNQYNIEIYDCSTLPEIAHSAVLIDYFAFQSVSNSKHADAAVEYGQSHILRINPLAEPSMGQIMSIKLRQLLGFLPAIILVDDSIDHDGHGSVRGIE